MLHEVLAADIPADEMSQLEHPTLGSPLPGAPTHGTRILFNALLPSKSGVPQAYDFLHGRDPRLAVRRALTQAVTALRAQYGRDLPRWRMSAAEHRFSSENYFGVPDTVPGHAIQFTPLQNRGTENDWIVLSSAEVTRCEAAPPGESGLIESSGTRAPHYDDQIKLYQSFACKPVWLSSKDVDANTESAEKLVF
jgi:penicillin amidase